MDFRFVPPVLLHQLYKFAPWIRRTSPPPRTTGSAPASRSPAHTSTAASRTHNFKALGDSSQARNKINKLIFINFRQFYNFSEFLLNHLHCNHKHRRHNGDTLDLTMVVPQIDAETRPSGHAHSTSRHAQRDNVTAVATQTWPFVEIYSHKRYFYLEAQTFALDGHSELFVWLWFLGG